MIVLSALHTCPSSITFAKVQLLNNRENHAITADKPYYLISQKREIESIKRPREYTKEPFVHLPQIDQHLAGLWGFEV